MTHPIIWPVGCEGNGSRCTRLASVKKQGQVREDTDIFVMSHQLNTELSANCLHSV